MDQQHIHTMEYCVVINKIFHYTHHHGRLPDALCSTKEAGLKELHTVWLCSLTTDRDRKLTSGGQGPGEGGDTAKGQGRIFQIEGTLLHHAAGVATRLCPELRELYTEMGEPHRM